MRRLALSVVLVLAAGLPLTAELALGATKRDASTHSSLQTLVCHHGLVAGRRLVSVTAVMRPLTGTVSMRMRFQLRETQKGKTSFVQGGDLGHWIAPHPATLGRLPADMWIVRHPVTGLAVPANYRFRVSFRWSGPGGRTIGQTVRWSGDCRQPDMRPNLVVKSIDVQPGAGSGSNQDYVAEIANTGLTAARNVEVQFSPAPGAAQPAQTVTIRKLRPHSRHWVKFVGPACTASTDPTVTVDPLHHINDIDPANNSLTAPCPPATSPGNPPPPA